MNGVIETSSGYLIRAGYTDFSADTEFDADTETYKTDVPAGAQVVTSRYSDTHKSWNGSAWVDITP